MEISEKFAAAIVYNEKLFSYKTTMKPKPNFYISLRTTFALMNVFGKGTKRLKSGKFISSNFC